MQRLNALRIELQEANFLNSKFSKFLSEIFQPDSNSQHKFSIESSEHFTNFHRTGHFPLENAIARFCPYRGRAQH